MWGVVKTAQRTVEDGSTQVESSRLLLWGSTVRGGERGADRRGVWKMELRPRLEEHSGRSGAAKDATGQGRA